MGKSRGVHHEATGTKGRNALTAELPHCFPFSTIASNREAGLAMRPRKPNFGCKSEILIMDGLPWMEMGDRMEQKIELSVNAR